MKQFHAKSRQSIVKIFTDYKQRAQSECSNMMATPENLVPSSIMPQRLTSAGQLFERFLQNQKVTENKDKKTGIVCKKATKLN